MKGTLLEGTKGAPAALGRVLVLGLGKSGRIASRYCAALLGGRVESLTIAAGAHNPAADTFATEMRTAGARVMFDCETFAEQYDTCIASPGISEFSNFYLNAKAASAEIMSEVEFAWRESAADSHWVAITGTNGKTTTTALVAHLLQQAGFAAAAVGNIGDTCLSAVWDGAIDYYVAEVSSYQLASTIDFRPDVAVVLNITPDHVAWHRSHENYVAAKYKVLTNLGEKEVAVFDATNETVRAKLREVRAAGHITAIPVGTSDGITGNMREKCGSAAAAYLREDGMLVVDYCGEVAELINRADLKIPGLHNVGNALMAASAALAAGAGADAVRAGLRSFTSLPHRIEQCGYVRGIACYNDSKATNVDATLKALSAFSPKRPIVLLGGDDKFTDLTELVQQTVAHCKAAVLYGASRDRFAQAFEGVQAEGFPVLLANHMEDAFDAALKVAHDGDIVLLSPACASFDEFDNFEQRGDIFKRLVHERAVAE